MRIKLLMSCCIELLLVACGGDLQPKPKAFLRLDYPEAQYDTLKGETPFSFEKNTYAKVSTKQGIVLIWTIPPCEPLYILPISP